MASGKNDQREAQGKALQNKVRSKALGGGTDGRALAARRATDPYGLLA
ncbi:MAG: hypothetical protein K6G15_00940 [Desulfovibrio sp.]|nr:hypothetical protein [Desulfovibrio sp.]